MNVNGRLHRLEQHQAGAAEVEIIVYETGDVLHGPPWPAVENPPSKTIQVTWGGQPITPQLPAELYNSLIAA